MTIIHTTSHKKRTNFISYGLPLKYIKVHHDNKYFPSKMLNGFYFFLVLWKIDFFRLILFWGKSVLQTCLRTTTHYKVRFTPLPGTHVICATRCAPGLLDTSGRSSFFVPKLIILQDRIPRITFKLRTLNWS